ncbi:transketolase [Pectinatus frisingensis]|uniref:transketolase n=1 Tax=Pectinatus frisingensis TaxID=865 RepID=UPI0018C548EC|nr:transketolase [Pectinatus frisingensis]
MESLKNIVYDLKISILGMFYKSKTGHLSSALSCVEILSVLFFEEKKKDDKIILSKGHAAATLYAILEKQGYISRKELFSFYGYNSKLLGLTSSKVNGIDIPTGSLGQGICFAAGIAKAYQMDKKDAFVYCVIGDGEMQEGSVWESIMFAGNAKLNHFIVILDHNKIQASDSLENIASINPIQEKLESFGWWVEKVNGHDLNAINDVIKRIKKAQNNKPAFIIADTIKGKGISFIEGKTNCHMLNPKGDEWGVVCKEFNITLEELKHSCEI